MKRRKLAKPTDKCVCGLMRKQHRGMGHYFVKATPKLKKLTETWGEGIC